MPMWFGVVIAVALMGGVFAYGAIAYRQQHGKWPW